MNPEFDYSKLNEKIIRTFLTRTAFCEAFGVSTSNLSLKMITNITLLNHKSLRRVHY